MINNLFLHGPVYDLIELQPKAHHKVRPGETLSRLSRKCFRYSSLEKFEDAFDVLKKFDRSYQSLKGSIFNSFLGNNFRS